MRASHAANLDVGGSQAQQVIHPDDRVRGTLSICGSRRLHLTIEPPAGLNLEILAGLRAIGEPRRVIGPWLAVAATLLVAMMVLS